MVGSLGPQAHTRPVVQPEPSLFILLFGVLQPFASPDALDPLVVHQPARVVQRTRHHPIFIAPILIGQLDDVACQTCLINTAQRNFTLRESVLGQSTAGAALRHAQSLPNLVNALAATRRLRSFPWLPRLE